MPEVAATIPSRPLVGRVVVDMKCLAALRGQWATCCPLRMRATFCYTAKARPTTNARSRVRVINSFDGSIVTRDICIRGALLGLLLLLPAPALLAEEGMWLFN